MSLVSFPATKLEFASFWDGEVDGITYGCLASFPYWGERLTLYSYNENIKIPSGVKLADAREICPDENLLTRYIAYGKAERAKFANLFRYLLLSKTNSCWVDADIICLTPPDFGGDEFIFGQQFSNKDHQWCINNAVLKLPSNSSILARLIEEARTVVDLDQPWGIIGPELVTRLFNEAGLSELAHPVSDFYPLSPAQFWMPLLPEEAKEVETAVSASTFLHLWHNQFKLSGYDKQAAPPKGSFLYNIFNRIGGLSAFIRTYDVDELKSDISEYLPREKAWSNNYARTQINQMINNIANLQNTNKFLVELFLAKSDPDKQLFRTDLQAGDADHHPEEGDSKPESVPDEKTHPVTTKIWQWPDSSTVVFGLDGIIRKDDSRAGVWYHIANHSNAVLMVWDEGGWLDFGQYDGIGVLKCRNNVGSIFDAVSMPSPTGS
jgi:hypothetical protein